MPIISTSLPSDGTTIDAADVNTPFNDILNVVNGNIDSDNVAVGGLNYDNFGTITGEIPASDMQDSGNVEKFRDEANVAFVASGCVWSTLTGLNGAMTAGVVYNANGVRNAPGAVASKTFTASRDTYVDIATNGAVSYSEVVNNDPSPALTANYVRIAKVVTDGSAVTSITQVGQDSLGNMIYNTNASKIAGVSDAVLSNPYKFSAYKSGAQNLASGTVTKVLFATENYDTNSNFASSTYTVPVNGFYTISSTLKIGATAANSYFIMIYVNGVEKRRGPEIIPGYSNNFGVFVHDTLQLTAGQTVEIYAYSGTGTGAIATGSNISYFTGELISRT